VVQVQFLRLKPLFKKKMISQQNKIISVATKLGATDIRNQQGCTREIWDDVMLPVQLSSSGINEFVFFENSKNVFPYSNIQNGQLEIGESLSLKYFTMYLYGIDPEFNSVDLPPTSFDNIDQMQVFGDINIYVSNERVIKSLALSSINAGAFNPSLGMFNKAIYYFQNNIILLPKIPFSVKLRTQIASFSTERQHFYLRCILGGLGSIYSAKTTI